MDVKDTKIEIIYNTLSELKQKKKNKINICNNKNF